MRLSGLQWMRTLGVVVGTALFAALFFFIFPTVAHAADDEEIVPAGKAVTESVDVVVDEDPLTVETVDTQPEIQNALGMPPLTALAYTNTADSNAIQQAVDEALKYASGQDTISAVTVVVDDGVYNGGISIAKSFSKTTTDETTGETTTTQVTYNFSDDFVLNIIAADARADDGSMDHSAGGAQVDGIITIDGIDVLLAGLYLVTGSVVKARAADVEIVGTTQSDSISADITDGATLDIQTGGGSDDITINGTMGSKFASGNVAIDIDCGDGNDIVTIDTSTALVTSGDTTVTIDGGDGGDTLHLTGTIKPGTANTGMRSGAQGENADITIDASELAGVIHRPIDIDTVSVEAYTDALKGKNSVNLSGSAVYLISDPQSFTDYNVTDYAGGSLVVTVPVGQAPFLSRLILSGDEFTATDVYAPDFNLTLNGRGITVDGTLTGRNICITAKDTDVLINLYTDFDSALIPDFQFQFSLFDFTTNAYILLTENAQLIASETICLKATSSQTQALLPDASQLSKAIENLTALADDSSNPNQAEDAAQLAALKELAVNPNFVNVKVGGAKITVLGTLTATQAIRAAADAKAVMSVTNQDLSKWCIPLGVSVAVIKSAVDVGGNAVLTCAQGGVTLSAKTDVTVSTRAVTGTLPIALALSVVDADAHVRVSDNAVISALGAAVSLKAEGSADVQTVASVPPKASDGDTANTGTKSGGFFAVGVVMLDVSAAVTGNATIAADGIDLSAIANENVLTQASTDASAVNDKEGSSNGSFSLVDILNLVTGLMGKLSGSGGTPMVSGDAAGSLNGAQDQVAPPEDGGDDDEDDMGLKNLFGDDEEEPEDTGVTDAFDNGTAGASDTTQVSGTNSATQLVGAIAVSYAGSRNSAVINTLGSVLSTGALSASANASTGVRTLADGSPIVKDAEQQAEEDKISVIGGTITTQDGDTAGDTPTVAYKAETEAPTVSGGTLGNNGTITPTDDEVVIEGITITVTGGKTIVTGPTGITQGDADISVPSGPVTITGGTTTVTKGKLTITGITGATVITIANGVLTVVGGTVAMNGGTTTNEGGAFDIPNAKIELSNVTIGNIESFGAESPNGLAPSALPAGDNLTTPDLKDANGDPASLPDTSAATVTGGGAEITDGTASFAAAGPGGITLVITGGNRNDDNSVITMADVAITGATLTVSEAYLTLTNGTVSGCTVDIGSGPQPAFITGGVIKYENGIVTITGATIHISLAHVTISGPDGAKSVKLSGGTVKMEGGATVVSMETGSPATTATITGATLTTEAVTPTSGGTSFSLGVGVSVGVVRHFNTAYISAAVISAQSISITANSPSVSANTVASAGVSGCDIGIAGAVSVLVVSAKTNARLGSSAVLSGGSVILDAVQKGDFTTSANAMGSGQADTLGIGAGIAIGIIGTDVNALVMDGAEITMAPGTTSLTSLSVSALYKGSEKLSAKAGIAGGTAIVPVLALGVSGVSVNARLGEAVSPITLAGDMLLSASSDIKRENSADADAAGGSVAVGASFAIGIYNDNTNAGLYRGVSARNVSVVATSRNSLKSTSKAGAKGAASNGGSSGGTSTEGGGSSGETTDGDSEDEPEGQGEADQLADRNVAAAGTLAGGSGTSNVNTGAVSGLSENRQQSQTSEGNVKVAAGLALNIQKNTTLAEIGDGFHVTATPDEEEGSGFVAVCSNNITTAEITANASATQSAIGVGVAVSINIVTYENIARVGGAHITANSLTISALITDKLPKKIYNPDGDSLRGNIVAVIQTFVDDALADIAASLGIEDLYADSGIATAISELVEEIATDVVNTMISGTGLEQLFNGNIDQTVNEALMAFDNLPEDTFEAVKTVVIQELINKIKSLIPGTGSGTDSGKSGLSTALQNVVTKLVTKLAGQFVDINQLIEFLKGPLAEKVKTKLKTTAKEALADIRNAAFSVLAGWVGTDAVALYGHSVTTEAISGAGASDVGVAGAIALAVVTGTTEASIAGLGSAVLSDLNIAGDVVLKADATNIIKSAASSAVGDDGKADKNKNAAANANGDTTGGSTPAPTDTEPTTGADSGATPSSPSTDNSAGSGKSVGVGASFAFNYVKVGVEAGIGENRTLSAGTLVIKATLENQIRTFSVSGTDPIGDSGGESTPEAKDISVDASIAVGLTFNTVRAYVGQGTTVTTTGGNAANISETEGEEFAEYLNTYLCARALGTSSTRASGFTVGTSTAVGAAVAVNIAYSNVDAVFEGSGVIDGLAKVFARTYNEDECYGIATAIGSDVDRYLSKFRDGQASTEKVLNGDYSGTTSKNDNNQTASTINGELDNNSNSEEGNTPPASNNNAPLSANAMNALDAGTSSGPSTEEGSSAVSGNVTDADGNSVSAEPGAQNQQSQKIRVAAALSVNITLHDATAKVTGDLTVAALSVLAENNGNFNAMGTGAAVSIDSGGNSIGVGVAVSVNKNEAHTEIGGTITALGDTDNDADISADANLTQNMDGRFKGLLGAQALAGAVTGSDSKFCISAAIAVIVSLSKTTAKISAGSVIAGGDVSVTAADKSKLAVRAGGLSVSTGASVGAGLSFAVIFAHNEVQAIAGSGTGITADSFTLQAHKLKVDFSDYESEFGLDNLCSYNAAPGQEGIVNLTKKKDANGDDQYSADVDFDTDSALSFVNLLNFLSSTNYYAESISGAVNTGSDGKLTAAGSLAFVLFFNKTEAIVEDGVSVTLTGDMNVDAMTDTTARVIAGAVSVSSSKVGIGATIGSIANSDSVTAKIGARTTGTGIDIGGQLNVNAAAIMDLMLITVAVGASSSGTAIGGTIDVIVTLNDVQAVLSDYASVKADAGVNVGASNDAFLLFIALSAAGSGGQTAVGGTFAVMVSKNKTQALVGDSVVIESDAGAVNISSDNKEVFISILAALSGSTGGAAVAATLNVQVTLSTAKAAVGSNTIINADGDVYITAKSKTFMLTFVAALGGSAGGVAVGATINVNVFTRTAQASVGSGCVITSRNGDVLIRALAEDWLLTLTAAIAFSTGGAAVTGCIPVVVGQSTVEAGIGENTSVNAYGSIGVIADLKSTIAVPALAVSASASGPGVGATINTVVLMNTINAIVCGGCTLTANANGTGLDVPGKGKRRGVMVSATASEQMYLISISGAVSSAVSVAGVLNTLVIVNKVTAQVRSRLRDSSGNQTQTGTHNITSGDEVMVNAEDDSSIIDVAGGFAVAFGAAGVGATLVVFVFDKDVTAQVESFGTIFAAGTVTVEAAADDLMTLFAIAFGAAATVGVSGGVNAAVYMNTVSASLGGTVSACSSLSVKAGSDVLFINGAAGAAGAGTVSVAAIFVVSYLYNHTEAYLAANAAVTSAGQVLVEAVSSEQIFTFAAGGCGAGTVSVSGTIDVAVAKTVTKAYTQDGVHVTSGSLNVHAKDTFFVLGVTGSIGGAGVVGIGISVLVVVVFNTIEASVGTNNVISVAGNVDVMAESDRTFDVLTMTGGAAGYVGISGALAALAVGSQLSGDTADSLKAQKYQISGYNADGQPILLLDGNGDPIPCDHGDDCTQCITDRAEPQAQVTYAFGASNKHAQGYGDSAAFGDMLEGNGENAQDRSVVGESFGQSGEPEGDDNDDKAQNVSDGMESDAQDVGNRGGAAPVYDLKDTTSAFIGAGSSVTAGGSITVEAKDTFKVDMVTGALAGAVFVAVGVGLGVAVLNGNVLAYVESGATLNAGGDIFITARAGSEAFAVDAEQEDRKNFLLDLANEIPGITDYTVRVISVSLGAALVSVNPALCGVSLYTQTRAYMAGNVTHANSLIVTARSDYGRVLCVTLGAGGGGVAVKISIAVVVYQGKVEASICSAAHIQNAGAILVRSLSNTKANALATALAGGGVSVNAAAAIAINLTRVDTFIGQGVVISGATTIDVNSDIDSGVDAIILSIALGAGAAGATVVVAVLNPTVLTYIGKTPTGDVLAHSTGINGSVSASGAISVENDVSGDATATGVSLAVGGMMALNGTVALTFNKVTGYAAISQTSVSAGSINVNALMDGDATVHAYAASLSAAQAGGLIVAIAIISTDNRALIDTTGSTVLVSGAVSVNAGSASGGYNSLAYVEVKTAAVAGVAITVNVGLTINSAGNRAVVEGTGTMTAGSLSILSRGVSQAKTDIFGINAGIFDIAMSVGIALLESTQEALLRGGGTYTLGVLTVQSYQNTDQTEDYDAVADITAGGGGLLSATAFITIVTADATGRASAGAASLTVNGAVLVESYGRSNAGVLIHKYATPSAATIGVMYGKAFAKGTFEAYLDTTNGVITAQGITVYTEYNAYAIADIDPAATGFSANYVSISGNIGQAEVDTIARAGIRGGGIVTSSKAISVKTRGTVSAYAVVHGATVSVSGYKIEINVATAMLSADQSAFFEDANVITTGSGIDGNVLITSEYNTPGVYDINGNPEVPTTFGDGATALVGANGGPNVELSIASGTGNIALAQANSIGSAYISGASTQISGDLRVRSFGISYANADIDTPDGSVSLVNVAVSVAEAVAQGVFSAYINSGDTANGVPQGNVQAGSISVDTRYNTKAVSKVSPGGGLSVKISLASGEGNVATADAATQALAYFTGSGVIASDSTIRVTVDGTGLAKANVKTASISVTALDIAANVTKANLTVIQKAYFDVAGTATAAGNITVSSQFDAGSNGALATTGSPNPPNSGISLSLVSGTYNYAKAQAKLQNSAYLTGGGEISGADVLVKSNAVTRAIAKAKSTMSASVIGVGSLEAYAYTNDTIIAYIGPNTTVNAAGDISVDADGNTTADALCDTPGSISLANVSGARVMARVGTAADDGKQTVKAYAGSGSTLNAGGNIDIDAKNVGKVISNISQGTNVSAVGISTCYVFTEAYYNTQAYVGSSAALTAGGSITVRAQDLPEAETEVTGTNVGILVSGGNMYAKNTLTQRVLTSIGADAVLFATGGISILAISDAKMHAKTNVNSGGIIEAGSLRAYNTLASRDVDISVGNGAQITADYGNIDIISKAGLGDHIYTCATGTSGGLVAISSAKAETDLQSRADTTIGIGVVITDTFNTITIGAYNGEGYINTIGDFGSAGLSSNPTSRAYVTDVDSNAKVTIANTSATGYGQTQITGRYVNVYASLKDMYVCAYTRAVTSGFHGTAKAYSTVTSLIDNTVVVGNAHIRSYDDMRIIASANPTSSGDNIKAYASTKITAFIGSIKSVARADGHINATTTIMAGADITGAYVKIDAYKFGGTVNLTAYGKRRALASKTTSEENEISRGRTVSVDSAVKFHIGDAAAGIVISIAADGSVRAVGIKGEQMIWTVSGGTVSINRTVVNAVAGRLYVGGLSSISSAIYDQQYIPEITIINNSNLDLLIRGIDPFNESYSRPSVSGVFIYNLMNCSEDTTPIVNILSRGSGNVTIGSLSGVVANERGTTNIIWENAADGMRGSLLSGMVFIGTQELPALWTHILNVQGAQNIGADIGSRFCAYLAVLEGENAVVMMEAAGDIFASLTLAEISAVASLPGSDVTTAIPGTLQLGDITAGGACDLLLPYAVRLKYLAGATAVSLVIPGLLEFSADTIISAGNITIDDIARYMAGINPADATLSYILPNGVQVFTDDAGKVLRVVSGTAEYNLTNFDYRLNGSNQLIITLYNKGVEINLSTGELTVLAQDADEGEQGFELYLGYDMWDGWYLGEGSLYSVTEYEAIMGVDGDGNPIEFDPKETLWKTVNGLSYYLIYDSRSEIWDTGTSHTYYVVVLDSSDRVVSVYKAKHVEHETSVVTGTASTVITVSGGVTLTETTYTLTFNNFASSGAQVLYQRNAWLQTWSDGDNNYSLAGVEYSYDINLGLSLTSAGSGYMRVANQSGLSGTALTAYEKLQGTIFKISITEDKTESFKGKLIYRRIDKTEDIPLTNITVQEDDESYSYLAFVFDKDDDERELCVYNAYYYNTGSIEYEVDLKAFTVEFTSEGYFGFTISGGGTITMHEGETITLYKGSDNRYRITENLYIGADGTIYFANGAMYNGYTGAFECGTLILDHAQDITAAGAVVMKAGEIHLELLSEDVALDADGNYYYYNGTAWVAASFVGGEVISGGVVRLSIYTENGITYHQLPDGTVLGSDGSISLPANTTETVLLTAITAGTDYLIEYIEGDTVTITMENTQGSLLDTPDEPETAGAGSALDIRATGQVLFKTASTGSIGTGSDPLEIVAGSIAFENLSGDTTLATDTYIVVADGDITFSQPELVISGCIFDLDVLNGSVYGNDLVVTAGAVATMDAFGDIGFDNVLVELISSFAMTAGGSVIIALTMTVNDSTATINAGGNISVPAFAADPSTVDMTAGGNITMDTFDADDSVVTMTAGGNIEIGAFNASISTVDMTAGGGIAMDTFDAANSTFNAAAGSGIAITTVWAADSTVDMTAGSDIDVGSLTLRDTDPTDGAQNSMTANSTGGNISVDVIDSAGSALTLAADIGGIVVPDAYAAQSTISMTAGLDIIFDILDGLESDVTLISTGGGIYATDEDSYMKMHDVLCSLTLSALHDIGRDSLHVRMDIPAEVVLHILFVTNYFIDAMIIPVPPNPIDPVYTGYDADGNYIGNDGEIPNEYIMAIGAETLTIDFDDITAEEWTQRLMDAMTRDIWLALVADGTLADMIEAGDIDADMLSTYLFDETITPELVESYLSVDPSTPEWQDTLDWLADMELQLRTLLVDTEGLEPTKELPDVITDEMATVLLAMLITGSAVGTIDDPASVMTPEEIAQMATLIAQHLGEQSAATAGVVEEAARAFNVLVGESVGAVFVTNEGDINITQQTGDMTVGLIDSTRGDVSLTTLDAAAGDILGQGSATHIESRYLVLSAAGSVGSAVLPLTIDGIANRAVAVYNILDMMLNLFGMGVDDDAFVRGTLSADARYDWLRIYDCNEATRLDVTAVGDVTITEARGDLGLGSISAGGAVTLLAPGGIWDVREASETDLNITAENLALTTQQSGIGTADRYIETEVTDSIVASAYGDIFISDTLDMRITADSATGQVNVDAENDLYLNNTTGDLVLGVVTAGGYAAITGMGAIVEDDRRGAAATVTADGMSLTALAGNIGTADDPFEVDSGAGTLSASGQMVFIDEISGDLNIAAVMASGDCAITAPGSIYDANGTENDAAEAAQILANEAQSAATAAQSAASVLQDYADRIKAQIDAADQAAQDAQDAVDAAQQLISDIDAQLATETDPDVINELTKQRDAAQDELPGLNDALTEALDQQAQTHAQLDGPYLQAQLEADAAQLVADALQLAANAAQQTADALWAVADGTLKTITVAGTLNLTAGGSIGVLGHGLGITVGGTVTATGGSSSGDNIVLSSGGSLLLGGASAGGTVALSSIGNLIAAPGAAVPLITASYADLCAFDGDIGEITNPLHLHVAGLSAIGNNVYIYNETPLMIGQINASSEAVIEVNGSVTGSGGVNITAPSLTLIAKGSIGTPSVPLGLDVGNLVMRGTTIDITNISGTLNIISLVARRIGIWAQGNVTGGGIRTTDIRITAFGSIGTKEDPLGVYAFGAIRLTSIKGLVYYTNLFHRHYHRWQERDLEKHYLMLMIVRIPFMLRGRPDDIPMAVYAAIGLREDGTWDILGLWAIADDADDDGDVDEDDAALAGTTILTALVERGVEQIDFAYIDGLAGMETAFEEMFPQAQTQTNAFVWMINTAMEVDEEDAEELLADLVEVYGKMTIQGTQKAFGAFADKWRDRYPQLVAQLESSLPGYFENFLITHDAGTGLYDAKQLVDAITAISEAIEAHERYGSVMDPIYSAFIQVLKFFPEYNDI